MWVDLEDVFYQLKSLFFPPFALHSRSYSRLWQSIPGNGNGNTKLHSQILGTGTGMKNSIPNFWEREREWKNHSQFSGTGMGGRYSREWPGTGIPAHPWNNFRETKRMNLRSFYFISPFLSGMHQPEKNLPLQAFKVEPRIGKISIKIHFFQTRLVYR